MKRNRRRGATMALVAALSFVLIILGFGVFFLAKLLGGGRQLQNATDEGNLNVAKQALVTPSIKVFPVTGFTGPYDVANAQTLATLQQNFSLLGDPLANGQIDLLTYNRLVGQALIVAMNASADGSNQGKADAQAIIALLNDPSTGIAALLANKLKNDSSIDTSFANLASIENLAMLFPQEVDSEASGQKDVSYMLAPTGGQANISNVYISPTSIPPQFVTTIEQTYSQNRYSNYYLNGYQFFDIPGVTDNANNGLMGVPLRPRQMPHLVAEAEFDQGHTPPFNSGGTPRVPPNAFKSGSVALAASANQLMNALSCSITGSISATQGEFTAAIPNGYIVIANGDGPAPATAPPGAALTFSGTPPSQFYTYSGPGPTPPQDIFDILMADNSYISSNPNSANGVSPGYPTAVSQTPGCINNIEADMYITVASRMAQGQPLYQAPLGYLASQYASDTNCLIGNNKYADAGTLSPPSMPPNPQVQGDEQVCSNISVSPPSQANPTGSVTACVNALAHQVFQNAYGIGNPPSVPGPTQQLSAIEFVKDEVINARATSAGFTIPALNTCTGMNAINLTGFTTPATNSADTIAAPSLNNLLLNNGSYYGFGNMQNNGSTAQTTLVSQRAASVLAALSLKMHQIKPTVQQSEIDTIFQTALPLGSVMYIWLDTTTNPNSPTFRLTNAQGLPSRINPNNVFADGTPLINSTVGMTSMVDSLGMPPIPGQPMPPGTGSFVDMPSDGGYEHPYDCVSGNGSTYSEADWYPSSGANAVLGVLRFKNCVNTGGSGITFDCPC